MWFHGSGMGYAPTQVADTEPPPDLVMNEDANLIPGQSKQKNQDNAMGHRSEIKEGQNESEEEEEEEEEDLEDGDGEIEDSNNLDERQLCQCLYQTIVDEMGFSDL